MHGRNSPHWFGRSCSRLLSLIRLDASLCRSAHRGRTPGRVAQRRRRHRPCRYGRRYRRRYRNSFGQGSGRGLLRCFLLLNRRALDVWPRRPSPHAPQKFGAVASAVPGSGGELLAMPLHGKLRPNRDRSVHPQACAGRRRVFQRRCRALHSGRVFPEDLGDRPHHRPRFDVTPVHAICIGVIGRGV